MFSYRLTKNNDKIDICFHKLQEAKDHPKMHVLFGLPIKEDQ